MGQAANRAIIWSIFVLFLIGEPGFSAGKASKELEGVSLGELYLAKALALIKEDRQANSAEIAFCLEKAYEMYYSSQDDEILSGDAAKAPEVKPPQRQDKMKQKIKAYILWQKNLEEGGGDAPKPASLEQDLAHYLELDEKRKKILDERTGWEPEDVSTPKDADKAAGDLAEPAPAADKIEEIVDVKPKVALDPVSHRDDVARVAHYLCLFHASGVDAAMKSSLESLLRSMTGYYLALKRRSYSLLMDMVAKQADKPDMTGEMKSILKEHCEDLAQLAALKDRIIRRYVPGMSIIIPNVGIDARIEVIDMDGVTFNISNKKGNEEENFSRNRIGRPYFLGWEVIPDGTFLRLCIMTTPEDCVAEVESLARTGLRMGCYQEAYTLYHLLYVKDAPNAKKHRQELEICEQYYEGETGRSLKTDHAQ